MRFASLVALAFATASCAIAASPEAARAADAATPAALTRLVPATVEYRWRFQVPEWTVEARTLRKRVYAPELGVARIDYALPGVRTEHRRIGFVPEFSCKYNDLALPNACTTTWRGVYVDVPTPVMRHDYLEFDAPRASWQDWDTTVEVPRLVWKEETLVVSLPALAAPEPADRSTTAARRP